VSSNSSQYTWLGNQLVPPNNVPIFHPKLYKEYFQKRNTLFVGDSLARRAYATIHGIIACNNSDIVEVEELVGKDGTLLGQNESKTVDKCPLLEGLTLPYYHRGYDCRLIDNGTNNASFVDFPPNTIGKFDFLGLPCARDIVQIVNPVMINRHGYDLVVVMIGAWELLNECRILVAPLLESTLSSLLELNLNDVDDYEQRMGGGTQRINTTASPPEDLPRGQEQDKLLTPFQKWELLLKTLSNEVSSSKIQVVIRTPGFSVKHNGDEDMWEMIRMTLQYFSPEEPKGGEKSRNVTIVDFGSVIAARSYGDHRISGDSIYHYGLEARLLFGQQLLHELFAAELRETGELNSIIL